MAAVSDASGWVTAAAAVAAVALPVWLAHRRTDRKLDSLEHQLRNQKRDIRRLERFARRVASILFGADPEHGRRSYDRSFRRPPDDGED